MTVVATFEIQSKRYLDASGKIIQKLPTFAQDPQNLITMYRLMTLLRVFDTKAVNLQRTGKIGTYAGIHGQEAVSVAVGAAMQPEDVFCPSYREYGAMIQRGVKLSDILSYWGGDERGSNFANKDDFPICVPIATQCLHAAGVAAAFKIRKQSRVAVSICGDGGTSEGDFYEAINLSGDWQLPVVFVVSNNQWAISVPRSKQTGALTLAQKAIAGGISGIQVDGNDVIAVREAVQDALEKARNGEGASLIEAITYRLCDHTTADDARRYRSQNEVEKAKLEEPLIRLRTYLKDIGAWSDSDEKSLLEECAAKVEQEVNHYLHLEPQPAEAIFDYLYEQLPEALQEQRQDLLENC